MPNIVYFDLETQKSAAEVGGWHRKRDMKMSVGVTFSTADGQYRIYDEAHVNDLVKQLMRADLVVGFNIINFDYEVLHGYTPLDLRADSHARFDGRSRSQTRSPHLAGCRRQSHAQRAEDRRRHEALRWWKEGRIMEIAEYCCFDVKITKELHEHGQRHGEVSFTDRLGQKRTVKVKW